MVSGLRVVWFGRLGEFGALHEACGVWSLSRARGLELLG